MKFGVTQTFACNYLPDKEERLLVCMEQESELQGLYNSLIQVGFRRSGEQLYRPHCENCKACESIRIICAKFLPSKSQKRVLSKNKDVQIQVVNSERDDYYALYEHYIAKYHHDGSMFPATYEQYRSFVHCDWNKPCFIEGRVDDKLIGVAVTDTITNGLSALYTFFEPSMAKRSLGTFFILQQIRIAIEKELPYLYLGYQIDECNKMNYKQKFFPHQRLRDNQWILSTK
ncbi:arginyltransferase [Glaciecola petra]|uniref:Aspartate/glutamate leucyltransferase n=1 Tax=Glaciecola petra TaxID=3075602 RepID=A0ABU2ZN14_9ALTE|nr:arginyltransferase [Aestuariibacter sp. P117]MDT0594017.1 arginyltransferase [Aestuariibacter sp. P117]